MLRKRIKKNTLKWKKIYAEQFLDMMDEEENALQKIYLTGYVLELKKNRYFAGWYKDRIDRLPFPRVCTLFSECRGSGRVCT